MEYKDYYEILGVKRDATQDEIKRAYRKLARKYHPDVSKEENAEALFKGVGEAYEVLKDPEKRAAYDQLGANWKAGQDFNAPPNWDAGFEFRGGGFTGGDASAYSDFFETLFGRGHGGRQTSWHDGGFNAGGEDHHARISINLDDAYHGATRALNLRMPELDASGRLINEEKTLNVKIPKGVREGQRIRLIGQGAPGIGGGRAGDLYLEIGFNPHPFYRVDGKDVYLDLPVAPWEAALGSNVTVPTPAGNLDLKIPPDSKSGGKLRLKGKGIPSRESGDFYVVLKIALPPADNEIARSAYREMEEKLSFNPRAALGV